MASVKKVPVSAIVVRSQVRREFSEADLRRLGASLQQEGQLQPIGIMSDMTLIYGERRIRAAILVGIKELEAKVFEAGMTPEQVRLIQLIENLQREDLTPAETWQGILEMKRADASLTNREIAEKLHLDPSSIVRYLAASDTPTCCQEAFMAGKLALSQVYPIAKLKGQGEAAQIEMFAKALKGVSRDKLEADGRKQRNGRSEQPVVKVAKAKLVLPGGGGEVLVSRKEEIDLDGVITCLTHTLEAAKRAAREGLTVATLVSSLRDKAKEKAKEQPEVATA